MYVKLILLIFMMEWPAHLGGKLACEIRYTNQNLFSYNKKRTIRYTIHI